MKTELIKNDIAKAAEIIKSGGLVGVPTETVYGLACNGLDEVAVECVYEVKGRPSAKPLSLMVSGPEDIERYCSDVPKAAYALAKRFWPGPLTIVLKSRGLVPGIVRAGGDTIALRCPDHPMTLELIKTADVPLAAPSANPSGKESPKSAEDVLRYFDGKISAVIDGGACAAGRESTIIDLTQIPYEILREGALPKEEIFGTLLERLNITGVTGGTGCGKTTALRVLEELGALVIDCDAVYHELLATSAELKSEIEARFPGATEKGEVNRKALGAIVFSDPAALSDLNAITHKFVGIEVNRRLMDWAKAGGELAAIDAIALIETGRAKMCRSVVGVTAPTEQRIKRLMQREGMTEEYARLRIGAQKPNDFFVQNCDYILENNGTIPEFREKCLKLFKELIL